MRTAFQIVNALVWLGVAISYESFGNSARLLGEAVIPLLLCLVTIAASAVDDRARRNQETFRCC